MKHLKTYNESINEYYQQITVDDWNKTFSGFQPEVPLASFTSSEKSYLLNVDKIKCDYSGEGESIDSCVAITLIIPGILSNNHVSLRSVGISYKLKDEWFYVILYGTKGTAATYLLNEFYKCDQFEGFIQLIKDKLL